MYNGWVIKHYLSVSISPLDWDFKKQQARTNNRADLQDINTILLRVKTELDGIIRNVRVFYLGKIPSKSEVQNLINSSQRELIKLQKIQRKNLYLMSPNSIQYTAYSFYIYNGNFSMIFDSWILF